MSRWGQGRFVFVSKGSADCIYLVFDKPEKMIKRCLVQEAGSSVDPILSRLSRLQPENESRGKQRV